jgi:hypothetical protein
MASVITVGGVEVSSQSGVPAARLVSAMVPLLPLYCVMVLYSGVVPNWFRKLCRVWA